MPIINPGDFPIDPAIVDGTELAARLNRLMGAIASDNSNATRPPYLTAGGVWTKVTATGFDLMMYDGTTDYKIGGVKSGNASFGGFEAGTVVLFKQSSAPIGWTKLTTDNDAAIRIVSGTAGTGGAVAFSSLHSAHTFISSVSGTVAGHAISEAEMPPHIHNLTRRPDGGSLGENTGGAPAAITGASVFQRVAADSPAWGWATTNTGGGQIHTHGWSGSVSTNYGSGTPNIFNMDVKYVDVIAASKD